MVNSCVVVPALNDFPKNIGCGVLLTRIEIVMSSSATLSLHTRIELNIAVVPKGVVYNVRSIVVDTSSTTVLYKLAIN